VGFSGASFATEEDREGARPVPGCSKLRRVEAPELIEIFRRFRNRCTPGRRAPRQFSERAHPGRSGFEDRGCRKAFSSRFGCGRAAAWKAALRKNSRSRRTFPATGARPVPGRSSLDSPVASGVLRSCRWHSGPLRAGTSRARIFRGERIPRSCAPPTVNGARVDTVHDLR